MKAMKTKISVELAFFEQFKDNAIRERQTPHLTKEAGDHSEKLYRLIMKGIEETKEMLEVKSDLNKAQNLAMGIVYRYRFQDPWALRHRELTTKLLELSYDLALAAKNKELEQELASLAKEKKAELSQAKKDWDLKTLNIEKRLKDEYTEALDKKRDQNNVEISRLIKKHEGYLAEELASAQARWENEAGKSAEQVMQKYNDALKAKDDHLKAKFEEAKARWETERLEGVEKLKGQHEVTIKAKDDFFETQLGKS